MASGDHVFQEGIGKVDHDVRSLHIQDGLILGDDIQVLIAQHLIPWILCAGSVFELAMELMHN